MYGAIVAVVITGIYLTFMLAETRTLPDDFEQIDAVNQSLQKEIDTINKLPSLPKLETSWRIAGSIAELHGVIFTPVDSKDGKARKGYSGPLRNWTAQLSGNPRQVLATARLIQSDTPTFLYDYTISSGIMKLIVTVVGT